MKKEGGVEEDPDLLDSLREAIANRAWDVLALLAADAFRTGLADVIRTLPELFAGLTAAREGAAEQLVREAIAAHETILGVAPAESELQGVLHRRLGMLYQKLGERILERACGHYQVTLATDKKPEDIANTRALIAYARIGRYEPANDVRRDMEAALMTFTAFEYPEDFAEIMQRVLGLKRAPATTRDAIIAFETISRCEPITVAEFVDAAGDVNARDRDGCAALHLAISEANVSLAKALLEAGASVEDATEIARAVLRRFDQYPNYLSGWEMGTETISVFSALDGESQIDRSVVPVGRFMTYKYESAKLAAVATRDRRVQGADRVAFVGLDVDGGCARVAIEMRGSLDIDLYQQVGDSWQLERRLASYFLD
ncbi:MAG TPA: hypothetical protein VGM90_26555 [Kofleriaceae bacterium]|jgi:hypothetical protein